jgi:hypothetical protein
MAGEGANGDPVDMAVIRTRRTAWPADRDGAVPPSVVCVLNGSPPGRAAAAYAAALYQALDWRVGLVASGLRALDSETLAAAVADERPGLAVMPVESCAEPADAVELANRTNVPVVVVPAGWRTETAADGDVVVLAREEIPELAGIATRIALGLGARLRLVHVRPGEPVGIGRHAGDRSSLNVAAVDDARALATSWGVEPVMLVPSADSSQRLAA